MIIKAKKFILRPYRSGDEESLRRNINNKKIYRYTSHIPYPYTRKHAQDWIGKNVKRAKKQKPESINFVIDLKGEVAGGIGFSKIDDHKAEIGYWLGEKYWNQGIMTDAVKLITKFGFENLKLARIFAKVYLPNKASKKVLEKAGFKLEGILRKETKKDDKLIDVYLLAKVR